MRSTKNARVAMAANSARAVAAANAEKHASKAQVVGRSAIAEATAHPENSMLTLLIFKALTTKAKTLVT